MLKSIQVSAIICLLCVHVYSSKVVINSWADNTYRLPSHVSPINYKLSITPYFEKGSKKIFTFDAIVEILFFVKNPVLKVTLHSRDLVFGRQNCTLKDLEGRVIEDYSVDFEKEKDFVKFSRSEKFPRGTYVLKIIYTGKISNSDAVGLFSKTYMNESRREASFVATHLQPIHARRVLPCFDEPSYKATFDVTVIHDVKYNVLSNMPKKICTFQFSVMTSTFERTPPMPTYLLALVVSNFKSSTNDAENVTIHSTYQQLDYVNLGLKLAPKILEELENFTNMTYKIGKLDHVGFPFSGYSAMENWGLITYGSDILFDERTDTKQQELLFSTTIAHELAHQWFGNIATPKWWKHVWLSESIATYISYYILEKVKPIAAPMKYFVADFLPTALLGDSSLSSLAIVRDADTPSEIDSMFSYQSTYAKGASIVRMLQHILTESVFRKSLQHYLKKTYHVSAETDDFYNSVQEVLNANNTYLHIKPILDSWLNFKGYPIVNVIRNYEKNLIQLEQEPFVGYNAHKKKKYFEKTWYIPINYASTKKLDFQDTRPEYWLNEKSITIKTEATPEDWIIVNKQFTGFYRVNYDEKNWKLIIDYLTSANRENIHEFNRAQLLHDAHVFAKLEILNMEILVGLLNYLKNETNCVAWYTGIHVLMWLDKNLVESTYYPTFYEFSSNIMRLMDDTVSEGNEKDDFTKSCRKKFLLASVTRTPINLKKVTASKYDYKSDDEIAESPMTGIERLQWQRKHGQAIVNAISRLDS